MVRTLGFHPSNRGFDSHWSHKLKQTIKKVKVEFYFKPNDETVTPRLEKARSVLTSEGGIITAENTIQKKETTIVTLRAQIPDSQYNKHHGFDSLLNKGYEYGGCGAGNVDDD